MKIGLKQLRGQLRQALAAALLSVLAWPVIAARTPTAGELMDWAEVRYAGFFPSRQQNQQLSPYLYRFYPETGNYLGVAGTGVWVLGPVVGGGGNPLYVGELSSFACDVFPTSCSATAFPSRPLRLVIPAVAGSDLDRLGRDLAASMQTVLGQTVSVVINAGGSGTLGANTVRQAAADGYTLLLQNMSMATVPWIYNKPPFSPLTDFEMVGMVAESPMALMGRTSLPASGYGQLAPWLAANGDKVSMGNAGIASLSHLCGVMFKFATQSTLVSIPYKGTAPMLTDLTTGQIDLACDELSTVGSLITTAKVKPYGVTTLGPTTLPPYAALPTLNQTGLTGFNVANWYGLYAPRGTPASVIERLVVGLRAAQADAEFRRRQLAASLVIVDDARAGSTGHRDFLNAEIIRWGPPILASGQFSD